MNKFVKFVKRKLVLWRLKKHKLMDLKKSQNILQIMLSIMQQCTDISLKLEYILHMLEYMRYNNTPVIQNICVIIKLFGRESLSFTDDTWNVLL